MDLKPNKNQLDLLSFLGSTYFFDAVDGELCICRKIGNHYDIEISGTYRKKRFDVYVWSTTRGKRIVEDFFNIPNRNELQRILNSVISKYQDLGPYQG